MANTKKGLNHYSVDTDRYDDLRIRKLRKDLGCKGIAVYDYLLCEIYKGEGCFLRWDANTAFEVADYFGLSNNAVQEIAEYCAAVGLFDKDIFAEHKVLTSASIQRRYRDLSVRARRKEIVIPEEFRLIEEKESREPKEKVVVQRSVSSTIEEEVDILKSQEVWLDNLQIMYHTDKEKLRSMLDDFRLQCVADGKAGHNDIQDAKRHFNSWMRIVINNSKKENNGSNNTRHQTGQTRSTTKAGSQDRRKPISLSAEEPKDYGEAF